MSSASKRRVRLNSWCERWVDIRDDLAYRKRKGEILDPDETARLKKLNAELEALLPKPQQLPQEVKDAMAEVKRLTQRERHLVREAIKFGKERATPIEIEIDLDDD